MSALQTARDSIMATVDPENQPSHTTENEAMGRLYAAWNHVPGDLKKEAVEVRNELLLIVNNADSAIRAAMMLAVVAAALERAREPKP